MAKSWVSQLKKQVDQHGTSKANWYAFWRDPSGRQKMKSFGPGKQGKRDASDFAKTVQSKLNLEKYDMDEYEPADRKTWVSFRDEYLARLASKRRSPKTIKEAKTSLAHFERIIKPARLAMIDSGTIEKFAAKRRAERGKVPGSLVSPATLNKDLRHIRAALRKAYQLEYIQRVPFIEMDKEPEVIKDFVTPEHFAAIYTACDVAKRPFPDAFPFTPAEWWRGLLMMAAMTGWRISELLALRWEDVRLESGTALTRHDDNKGKRDGLVDLHENVVEHLKRLKSFDSHVFAWNHDQTTLHNDFVKIQKAAGIRLVCRGDHEHTDRCHYYGFHAYRRAFATWNVDRMTKEELGHTMRHKSFATTERHYIMAKHHRRIADKLFVPSTEPSEKTG